MKLRILGCSGGISAGLRTTSFLLGEKILIDAGTGVGDLSLEELRQIDHVFLTHSHLDHIASIPFLVDTVGHLRDQPLIVHASAETIGALQQHIFNWVVWPDFAAIPDRAHPYLTYQTISGGQTVTLEGCRITPIPANHTVPAVGYHLDSGQGSLVFTGDTTTCDALWATVNQIGDLRHLIVETAFCNREYELAVLSKHLCPSLLADELRKLKRAPQVYITHLKPSEIDHIMQEVEEAVADVQPQMLRNGQVIVF